MLSLPPGLTLSSSRWNPERAIWCPFLCELTFEDAIVTEHALFGLKGRSALTNGNYVSFLTGPSGSFSQAFLYDHCLSWFFKLASVLFQRCWLSLSDSDVVSFPERKATRHPMPLGILGGCCRDGWSASGGGLATVSYLGRAMVLGCALWVSLTRRGCLSFSCGTTMPWLVGRCV